MNKTKNEFIILYNSFVHLICKFINFVKMNYNKINNSTSEISLNFNNPTSSKNNYFHPSSSNSKSTLNSLEIASDENYNYNFLSLRPEFDENSANDDQKSILSPSSESSEFVPRKKQTISGSYVTIF